MSVRIRFKVAFAYILVFILSSCRSVPSATEPVLPALPTSTATPAGALSTQSVNTDMTPDSTFAPAPSNTIEKVDQPGPTTQIPGEVTIAPTVDINTIVNLKQELYFTWGAEGGGFSSRCTGILFAEYDVSYESELGFFTNGTVPPELEETPILPFFSGAVDDEIHLCIYGFPEDEIITVELYTPEDILCVSQDVSVSDYYYQAVGEITEVDFTMDWPRCSYAGQWTLVVKSASVSLREPMGISWEDMAKLSASSLCDSPDGHISVQGVGYPHGESRLLGVYGACSSMEDDLVYGSACKLLESYLIKIGDDGSFDVLLPSNLSGEYIVVPIIEDDPPDRCMDYDLNPTPGVIHYPETCGYLLEEEIVNTVKQFNADQTLAVRELDSQILQDICTDECFSWHIDYINELREGNLYEVQEQLAFEVTFIDILDNTATVTTRETWRTQKYDRTTHECRYHQPTFSTQQTYTLVYDDGVWKVSWNNFDTPVPADKLGCLE